MAKVPTHIPITGLGRTFMSIEPEILAYRRNFRSRRISGTQVLRSGLYFASDGRPLYLSQGDVFPYGTKGVPLTWALSATPIGSR